MIFVLGETKLSQELLSIRRFFVILLLRKYNNVKKVLQFQLLFKYLQSEVSFIDGCKVQSSEN
jgi:hypothetical protein